MAPEQATLDPKKVDEFLGKAISDVAATFHAGLVLIGDKLGLYRAMAGAGPMSPADLAKRTGARERYVREWLSAQAAGGYVTYEPATGRFTLPPEQAFLLLDADLPGAFQLSIGSVRDEPKISDAFRTGAGVGWHEHDAGVYEGCERFFRPGYAMNLVSQWIPALEGVKARLEARRAGRRRGLRPRRVHASSWRRRSPARRFTGFDYHPASIEAARQAADKAGVADRLSFEVIAAKDVSRHRLRPGHVLRLPARHGRSGGRGAPRAAVARSGRGLDARGALRQRPAGGQPQPGRAPLLRGVDAALHARVARARRWGSRWAPRRARSGCARC